MEFKIVELACVILVAGALILLGLKTITFDQALTLITIAISLLTGKYVSRYEEAIYQWLRTIFKR
jgi:hypothetical protein